MKINFKIWIQLLSWLVLATGIYFLGQIPRDSFGTLFLAYTASFGSFILFFIYSNQENKWLFVFLAGLVLRLVLFNSTPQWSDDYARFLWDGELIHLHENPFSQTPESWLESHPDKESEFLNNLFGVMNSPNYYSIYPPSNQLLFWVSAYWSNQEVGQGLFFLRCLILLAEVIVFFLFSKLLNGSKQLILYWLNPFVILEIVGNLHFEGLVLLSLLGSLFAFRKNNLVGSGAFWSLAIGFKILPLMLLPSWIKIRKIRKSKEFWLGVAFVFAVCFLPLWIDDSWKSLLTSLQLYQGKFEFNASIYYLFREIGFWLKGYNTIETLTKLLSLATLIGIVFLSWKRKIQSTEQLSEVWVLIYLVYLLLQPVVHPWYLIPAFGLSLLTKMISLLFWCFSAILSYHAYSQVDFEENPWMLFLEYLILGIGLVWDYKKGSLNLKSSIDPV